MSTQVTIQSITGATTPLNLWICDSCDDTASCQYVDTINTLPHSFVLPSVYEVAAQYAIKLYGSSGCTFCQVY
jgi:hypothetical protein